MLLETIDRLAGATVGVIGDMVADRYVSGQSDRVSREAPVLILQYEEEWLRPGGAANVAANVAALGATACMVGLVGEDESGRRLLEVLKEKNGAGTVECEQVLVAPGRDTVTKTRYLAGAKLTSRQQVLRLDRQPGSPPDETLLRAIRERVRQLDPDVGAWVISDYGYGVIDAALREVLREIAEKKPVVADSRFGIHLFRGMTVIKPNEEEAAAAARALGLPAIREGPLAGALADKLEAQAALVTLGNKGMMLGIGKKVTHIPAVGGGEIVDLTGAGDSVAATVATALAGHAEIEAACNLANHAGAIVVMKEGAATASPDELRESVARRQPDSSKKTLKTR